MSPIMRFVIVAAAASALGSAAHGQLSFTGAPLGQDFNTLSGTNLSWTNNVTLPGWSLFRQPAPGVALTSYVVDGEGDGIVASGGFGSFGPIGSSERALGGLVGSNFTTYFGNPAEGAIAGWMAFAVTNNTGFTQTGVTIRFDGEQWRVGGAFMPGPPAQTMVLEYGYGAAFETVPLWTAPGGSFNWTAPIPQQVGAQFRSDGNGAGLAAGRGGTLAGQSWLPGDTLWVRWVDRNDVGGDDALAIDNFTFSAVPAPGAGVVVGMGVGAVAGCARRRRRG